MRYVTYASAEGPRVAALRNDWIIDLNRTDAEIPPRLSELLARGTSGLRRAELAAGKGEPIPLNQVKLVAPIPRPEKVICIGLNYVDHAKEGGSPIPTEPVVFCKFPTAICADGDAIEIPRVSSQVDYEAELVVVIGRCGRHIARSQALDYVGGYCCGNDISARDWQSGKSAGQWLLGKSFDGFAPFGPFLATADEVPEPGDLRIQLRLNGKTMQDSNTSQLMFPVDELVAYVSQVCTLKPGDVLFTGTPAGVGYARKPPVFLNPDDFLEVEISRLGTLHNRMVAESS
jgi:2-keto-4-pentenoate hydratase/2-oxohepta-3-ene-1,7-dioic acid hydratase in catechol pathway